MPSHRYKSPSKTSESSQTSRTRPCEKWRRRSDLMCADMCSSLWTERNNMIGVTTQESRTIAIPATPLRDLSPLGRLYLSCDPSLTTVVRDSSLGKTTVTFRDKDEIILAEVIILDEGWESDDSDG
ncbi:hypothetical protein E8E14_005396 [Neopestalotiopsis sp. 37M]|nr:hypothetical protein E8E14_005396 [Neopestalotiopsis sp. 37M]